MAALACPEGRLIESALRNKSEKARENFSVLILSGFFMSEINTMLRFSALFGEGFDALQHFFMRDFRLLEGVAE
ncbi:MAG: hypothetical protein HKUEN02_09830 [Anaerolineaceae bacterium]|nr:MAG: hypothetical protein HKUEN02_09830 [Anaerolineaceae bacterium]